MWEQEIHEHVMRRDEEEYEVQTKAEDNPKKTQCMRQNLKRCNVHAVSCGKVLQVPGWSVHGQSVEFESRPQCLAEGRTAS